MTIPSHPTAPLYGAQFSPVFPTKNNALKAEPQAVELLWSLYRHWPQKPLRWDRAKKAAFRMASRRAHVDMLPSRKAYLTTVDYYEAALPLFRARSRFLMHFPPGNWLREVNRTCAQILPKRFF